NSRTSWTGAVSLRSARERNDFMRRRPGNEVPVLLMPKAAVDVAAVEQFLVRADVVNAAALEDEDRIRIHQRGEAVRDNNQGAALRDAQQVGVDDRLAVRIERARRLIEDQDARITDQRAGDRETLPLAARQVCRALLDKGLIAARQALDELLGAGKPRRLHDFLETRIGLGGGNRLTDRAAEQKVLLQSDNEAGAEMIVIDIELIDV